MIGLVPVSDCVAIIHRIIVRCHRSLAVCMFSPPSLGVLHYTFDHFRGFDDGQQTLVAS